jgi:allantoinase
MKAPRLLMREDGMSGWRWPNKARLAMSFVVNVEEGSEMSIADGDKRPEPVDELGVTLKVPIRNFGNESNYRYGLGDGGRRVLAALEAGGVRATFTAAGLALERAPELTTEIKRQGHEIASHGWRWIHQFAYDEAAERDFIRKAVRSIERMTGSRPLGWLSRYLHTAHTRRLLVEEGFTYHMDDYSADAPFWDHVDTEAGRKPIVIMPYALDSNDMKFWLAPAFRPADWLDYAVETFERLYKEGAEAPRMMSLGLHLRIIGRPGRIGALERFIAHVRSRDDVLVATRLEMARHFAAHMPAP